MGDISVCGYVLSLKWKKNDILWSNSTFYQPDLKTFALTNSGIEEIRKKEMCFYCNCVLYMYFFPVMSCSRCR